MKRQAERVVRTAAPLPPIRMGGRTRAAGAMFGLWLTLFLRCVGIVWIGEGLLQWIAVLTDASEALLTHTSSLRLAAVFFFCVLDFVAAVGLWLVATWGVAVWIATMAGHLLVAVLAPDILPERTTTLAGDALLVVSYAVLATLAAREERPR